MSGVTVPCIEPEEAVQGRYLVVDVRAPVEFDTGSVPGSVNLPLLDDEARAHVGTVYAQLGSQAARLAAMDTVSPILPQYLRTLLAALPPRKRPAVLCWRGGERSRNVVLLLALVGVHAVQVRGGYRAYRRWVRESLENWAPPVPVFTLHGPTGSGKSQLLRTLRGMGGRGQRPRPWVVDLEGLALHRGSLLGGLNQPGERTQKDFEALLWDQLRCPHGDYLLLEGEGRRIGRLSLPAAVAAAISTGRPVHVAAPVEARTQRILHEYAPGAWSAQERRHFLESIALIGASLPASAAASLRTAFEDGRFAEVVQVLLVHYYDPLYQRSSVEGRDFVLRLVTGADAEADARRLRAGIASVLSGGGARES